MRSLASVFFCAGLLCSAQASAGVVYAWQMTQPSATIHQAGGFLELTEEAARSTGVNYAVTARCEQDSCVFSDPSSPILRFEFWTNGSHDGAYVNPISGRGLTESGGDSVFNVSFSISGQRINDFSVTLANFDTTMVMENGNIVMLSSDWEGCQKGCEGSSGFFREANVPEPGSLALIGLGMLGLAYGLRRKQTRL